MIEIIVILAVIIVVVVGMVIYTQQSSSTNSLETKQKEFSKGMNDVKGSNKTVEAKRIGKGGLLERCPCAEPFECSVDEGHICKIKEGSSCSVSPDCNSNAFCFNAICTVKPENEGTILIRNTPMFLSNNRFQVIKGWWDLTDVIDIHPSPNTDSLYYLLTEAGKIFRVDANPRVNGRVEIPQANKMEQILHFDKHFYGLSKGHLYELTNEADRLWSWGKVNKLYNQDISTLEIYELTTVEEMLVFMTGKGIYHYDKATGEWLGPEEEVKRVMYGRTRNFSIKEYKDGKIIYRQNNKEFPLEGNIIDFALDKRDEHIIYILFSGYVCYSNIYNRKEGADDISVRLLGNVTKIISEKNRLWGLSTYKTYNFDS